MISRLSVKLNAFYIMFTHYFNIYIYIQGCIYIEIVYILYIYIYTYICTLLNTILNLHRCSFSFNT